MQTQDLLFIQLFIKKMSKLEHSSSVSVFHSFSEPSNQENLLRRHHLKKDNFKLGMMKSNFRSANFSYQIPKSLYTLEVLHGSNNKASDEESSNEIIQNTSISNFSLMKNTLALHNYEIKQYIATGGFAKVFKVYNTKYNQDFALKVFDLSPNNANCQIASFSNEIESLQKLNHPNIIRIYDFFEDANYLYLVLEYCPLGTLSDLIAKSGKLSYSDIYIIISQVLDALKYCHMNNIAHSDIKPSNILFDQYGRVKIADFGLSINVDENQKSRIFSGSTPYMAPEILAKKPFDPMIADIWALGVMLYQMVFGTIPWIGKDSREIKTSITMCHYSLPFTNNCLRGIIKKILVISPNQRPSIFQIQKMLIPPGNNDISPNFVNQQKNYMTDSQKNQLFIIGKKNILGL